MNQKRDTKASTTPDNLRNRLFGQSEPEGSNPNAARQPASVPAPAPRAADGSVATIGATMSVKGDIASKEDVLVKGKVEGSVVLNDNDMVIDESGHLEGNVTARHVLIRGAVNGEIEGLEKVTIAATGRVQGTIAAPRVVLEDGGKFKGMIDMPLEEKGADSQSQKPAERNPATAKREAASESAAKS